MKNWNAEKNLKAAQAQGERVRAETARLWEEMVNDRPPSCFPMDEVSPRMARYVDMLIEGVKDKLPPSLPADKLREYVLLVIKVVSASSGWIFFVMRWIGRIWNALPWNVTQMILGMGLCYFGGTFMTTLAAVEAFRTMGYEKAAKEVLYSWKAMLLHLPPSPPSPAISCS